MDVLTKLESRVELLLARLGELKLENSRLLEETARQDAANNKLTRENEALREAMRKENAMRQRALERLECLLRKLRDYTTVG